MYSKPIIRRKKRVRPGRRGRRRHDILAIRRSCLTGKVVWLCSAKNKRAAAKAYCIARRAEVRRQAQWKERVNEMQKRMLDALNDWIAEQPITKEFTEEQIEHIRFIQTLAQEEIPQDREFYEHILAADRNRDEDQEAIENRREKLKNGFAPNNK